MADRNEKVYKRIRQELMKTPDRGSSDLYEVAKGIDSAMGEQTLQQFHARYVLPVKREQAKKRGGSRRTKPKTVAKKPVARRAAKTAIDRDHVRGVLLQFAKDFSAAESKTDIVGVMSRVDEYVDQIAGA